MLSDPNLPQNKKILLNRNFQLLNDFYNKKAIQAVSKNK